MSKKSAGGCLGCLGNIVILTFFGSMFFGGGVSFRVGGLGFTMGDPIDRQQIINTYLADLETSKKVAEESSQKFRIQIEQGQCKDAYDQASEIFKKTLSHSEMMSLCKNLQRSLGAVKSVQLINWWGQPTDKKSDKYILLNYTTMFSKSPVRETFIWLVKDGGKAELLNYEILFAKTLPNDGIKKTQPL